MKAEPVTLIGNQPNWLVITSPTWRGITTSERTEEHKARGREYDRQRQRERRALMAGVER